MDFIGLLEQHLEIVRYDINKVSNDLLIRGQVHDQDKIFNKTVYNTYEKYFAELKKIDFGTPEYFKFERDYFDAAHQIHAQNRHHFYSPRNVEVKPNLIDLLEAVIDINASNKQYNPNSKSQDVLDVFVKKGITKIDLEEYLLNTLEFLNEK